MNTTKHGLRTVLAAVAAGTLVLGSAAGATAKGKPETVPAPQKNDRVVSVSIKGHAPINLATAPDAAAIKLRAKLWDPNKDSKATTISVKLGVYTKKVGGNLLNLGTVEAPLAAPLSQAVPLTLQPGDETRKVKDYAANPGVKGEPPALWTAAQLGLVAAALDPGEKAYVCIAEVSVSPATKYSMQVKKRLGMKGKAVRDCVKVIDSTPLAAPAPAPQP
ncbi:MAG TPA: hypothetical protein VF143_07195 [Candidatus Nanopelagicales bacterium]